MSDTHLFLLVPNDSGSTWLQNNLTRCANCIAFPVGLDGKGAAPNASYPDQEINKLFSEKEEMWRDPTGYDWPAIKQEWKARWSESPHFHTANPKVFLEKTPQAIYASDMYVEHFPNVRFVISIRNPYAVSEGIRRTVNRYGFQDVNIERCARHWVACARRQIYNLQTYSSISAFFTYDELVNSTSEIEGRIRELVPALEDLDFSKAAKAHSLEGIGTRELIDYNEKQISRLSAADISAVTEILKEDLDVVRFFGFDLLGEPVTKEYIATPEEIAKDKEDFYAQGGGKIDRGPSCNAQRLLQRWGALLQEQNGENFDDYAMAPNHKVTRYIERWAPTPGKVLFLGTGTGREVHAARIQGYEAEGTTLGKENLPFAKWKFDLDLFYGDNCTMPYPDKTFDVVAGFQIFEHCHAPYMFLVECCRVLKEGGVLMLEWPPFMATADGTATPNPGEMHNFMGDFDDDNVHHMCCWTPAQAWIMVRRCGFENVELFISGFTNGGRSAEEGNPDNLSRIAEEDDAFWSNVSPGDIVLKATRRPDGRQPRYMRRMLNG